MHRRLLWGLMAFFLVVFVYESAMHALVRPGVEMPAIPGGLTGQALVLVLFGLTHALYALGWRHMLVFFGLSAVISWAYEHVGVSTGWVYGPYHYTDVLGMKVGHVPALIPLAWFMMSYPSYIIANLIADGQPMTRGAPPDVFAPKAGRPASLKAACPALPWGKNTLGGIAWVSVLSAFVMTAWDVILDPVLSGPDFKVWVWDRGGLYYGIPVQNFVGWMVTAFTVYLLYRLFERRVRLRPIGPVTRIVAIMPLVAYGAMMISNSLVSNLGALRVIGPVVMGLPLVAAVARLGILPKEHDGDTSQ